MTARPARSPTNPLPVGDVGLAAAGAAGRDLGADRLRRPLAGHRRVAPEYAAAAAHEQVPAGGHRAVPGLADRFPMNLPAGRPGTAACASTTLATPPSRRRSPGAGQRLYAQVGLAAP